MNDPDPAFNENTGSKDIGDIRRLYRHACCLALSRGARFSRTKCANMWTGWSWCESALFF